jgi:hypothetical protein
MDLPLIGGDIRVWGRSLGHVVRQGSGKRERRLSTVSGGPYGIDASAHRLLEGVLRQPRSIGSVTDPSGCVASGDAAHSSGGTGCAELGGDW